MSKSASLPAEQFEPFDPQSAESGTPAWKQEVNQKLAAHRTRRGGQQEAADARSRETPKAASSRAAQAAARVAERYAKAPSYSQLLAGEARAVVRAAGAAAEAARHAQAAAQYVLAGLESGLEANVGEPAFWEPVSPTTTHSYAEPSPSEKYRPEMTAAQQAWAAEPAAVHIAPSRWQDEAPTQGVYDQAALKPRWEEALPVTAPPPERDALPTAHQHDVWAEMRLHPAPDASNTRYELGLGYGGAHTQEADEAELFPYDPVASATIEPVQHIPANLIEFPRELVATRKARPRLADGPYRETAQDSPQLSIFEVDPELLAPPVPISNAEPEAIAPPEWASIELNHAPEVPYAVHDEPQYDNDLYRDQEQAYNQPALQHGYADSQLEQAEYGFYAETSSEYAHTYAAAVAEAEALPYVEPSWLPAAAMAMPASASTIVQPIANAVAASPVTVSSQVSSQTPSQAPAAELLVASVSDRLLAGVVDAALVTLAFLSAAVVVIASTAHPPTGRIALVAASCGLILFGLLYQFLFFSYAEEGTPGMRYARIALCTFDDDNPSREQMRMRIPATVLSVLPLGLGMLWAIADSEKLSWHDRLTRTYQRKY